jgi:hypothetical protein
VEKPVLGDVGKALDLDVYRTAVTLMYATSVLAFVLALSMRYVIVAFRG